MTATICRSHSPKNYTLVDKYVYYVTLFYTEFPDCIDLNFQSKAQLNYLRILFSYELQCTPKQKKQCQNIVIIPAQLPSICAERSFLHEKEGKAKEGEG